jgi:hypothetical protein
MVVVNANEFFLALTGLPGVRSVPVGSNGITESRFVAGVEIARAASSDDRALDVPGVSAHGADRIPSSSWRTILSRKDPCERLVQSVEAAPSVWWERWTC